MIAITSRPDRPHKSEPLFISRHICSRHPAVFQFQRQDWTLSNIINDGGFAVMVVSVALASTDEVQIGDKLYCSTYNQSGTVTSMTIAGGSYYWKTDLSFSAFTGGYIVHLSRIGYHIDVTVMIGSALNGKLENAGTLRLSTNNKGKALLDVSSLLSAYFEKKNLSKYNAINWRDDYVHSSFYIKYQESWRTGSGSLITDQTTIDIFGFTFLVNNIYTAIDATKYLLDDYGQNLCDYLPSQYSTINPKAKFLSDFDSPTFFPGYPFDLAFIYPTTLSALSITKEEEYLDGAGAVIGSDSFNIDSSKAGGVHRLRWSESLYPGMAALDVYLKGNSVAQSGYYNDGYVADGYYELSPAAPVSVDPYDLTEKKRIKIFSGCPDRPVYLSWRGTKGNWNYWLFTLNQQISYSAKGEGEYTSEPIDLETGTSRKQYSQMSQVKKMRLFSRVAVSDMPGLSTIEGSPCVQMLWDKDILSTEPERAWLTVRIVPKGFTYQTKATFAEVEVEIELPELYTIPN